MIYDIKKSKEYVESYLNNEVRSNNIVYDALIAGGLQFGSVAFLGKNLNSVDKKSWDDKSDLNSFVSFWKKSVDFESINFKSNGDINTGSVSEGDVIVFRDNCKEQYYNFFFVINLYKDNSKEELAFISNDGINKSLGSLKTNDIIVYSMRFSLINRYIKTMYKTIFSSFPFDNQYFLTKLIYSCCLEPRKSDGKKKEVVLDVFLERDITEFKEEIEKNVLNNPENLLDEKILSVFIDRMQVPDGLNKIKNRKKLTGLEDHKSTLNDFLDGKKKYNNNFWINKSNRRLFQERFSIVLQYYLLIQKIIYKNDEKLIICESEPEGYAGTKNTIYEFITFDSWIFERITEISRFLTRDEDLVIDSLYALSGHIFDTFSNMPIDKYSNQAEEFERYRELVICYGRGTLDYFFALNRFKDTNHFVAEELSEIYYYGATYEDASENYKFVVKPNRTETVILLNSCKDYSVSARWSLGENYKKYASKCREYISRYNSKESMLKEFDFYYRNKRYSDELEDISNLTKTSINELIVEDDAWESLENVHNILISQEEKYQRLAVHYYESCSNYPPAMNSIAILAKNEASELQRRNNGVTSNEITQKLIKAIKYATKAASFGWVYAFNNLYAWLKEEEIQNEILKDVNGMSIIQNAYDILTSETVTSDIIDPKRKNEEEFISIKRKLKDGISKRMLNYYNENEEIIFKYEYPIENPVNFLVVSAYMNNLYGVNHLGMEYAETKIFDSMFKARILFEHSALYGSWGYFNLAKYIYYNDFDIKKELLEKAAQMGNEEAAKELNNL